MTAPDVRVRVAGEDAGATALLRGISATLTGIEREQKRASTAMVKAADALRTGGSAARQAATDTNRFAASQRAGEAAVAGLARRVVALVAAYAGISRALSGLRRGLDVNAELEAAQLGIAALIAAQGGLRTSSGRTLEAAEALNAAQGIAAEQLQALRIAGLQTSATFQQLAEGFQSAVGPGLAAGLSLEQIRAVTIGVTQAATALQVPAAQLAQEVRSILEGTIDVNSRVAKTLGITNAQVKLERERGTLATFLLQKLEAFTAAGAKSQDTFRGVASSMRAALDVFAGEATRPLFERLRVAGKEALERVFDVRAATLQPAFQTIVTAAGQAFDGLGARLAGAITAAVRGAEQMARFLQDNRVAIEAFAAQLAGAGTAFFGIVREAGALARELATAAIQSGLVSAGLATLEGAARVAAGAIQLIRENLTLVVALLTGGALAAGIAKLATLGLFAPGGIATAIGLGGVAIAAAPVTAAVVAITGLVVAVEAVRVAQERAREATLRANAAQTQAIQDAPALIAEYRTLAEQIEQGALKGEELKKAQDRIRAIKDRLIQLSPQFRAALESETTKLTDQATQAEAVVTQLKAANAERVKAAKLRLADLEQRERDLAAAAPPSTEAAFVAQQARQRQLREEITQTRAELTSLGVELTKPPRLPGVVVTTPKEPVTPGGKPKGDPTTNAKNDLKQLADAAIDEQKRLLAAARADLDRQLEANTLSYAAYFAAIERATVASVDRQIAEQRKLLAATADEGEQAQILERIRALEAEKTKVVAENAQRRVELETRLARQVEDVELQLLRARGQAVEARRRELVASFAALRARLIAENRTDAVAIIDALINVEVARERLGEIEAAFQRAQQARTAAEESIQTRIQAGVLSEEQGRRALLQVYRLQRDAILALLPALEAQARRSGSANDVRLVVQYRLEVEKLNLAIRQSGDTWARAGGEIRDAVQSDLAGFLANTGREVRTLGQAFASLAGSVIASIQRITAALLAARIVGGIAGLLGGGGGLPTTFASEANSILDLAAGGVPGFAAGGYTGPGARHQAAGVVHADEYVVPSPLLRRIGLPRLEAALESLSGLRAPRSRRPRRSYAEGGLVVPEAGGLGGALTLGGTVTLGLADGLVPREFDAYLETPAGERRLLAWAARNKRKLQTVFGGR